MQWLDLLGWPNKKTNAVCPEPRDRDMQDTYWSSGICCSDMAILRALEVSLSEVTNNLFMVIYGDLPMKISDVW